MCDDSFHKESENTGGAKMDDSGLEEAESGTLDSLSNPAHKLSESIEDTHFPDSKESSGIDLNDSNEQNCKDSTASPLKVKDHCSGDAAASCHVDSKKETSVGEDKTESIASNISKSANFLGGANTPDRNDDDNVADPDLPTETIASPTDPKKMKTSADIHTDDDSTGSNEYKDASDELNGTRMKRKRKLRNRNLESDDGGNDSEHNSSSSIHIDSSSSSSLSHSESKDEEVEDQVWLNEGILDLPPRKWHSVCSLRQRETLACTRYWT
uniref:Uncharacterized protein n=1 Tax=Ciona savignyi TaxID=51511 RepID=H2YRQ8_CIOSA